MGVLESVCVLLLFVFMCACACVSKWEVHVGEVLHLHYFGYIIDKKQFLSGLVSLESAPT